MPSDALLEDGHSTSDRLPVDAKSLANLFLDWAQTESISVTPMKLQKMLFFCHADFLVQLNSRLVIQDFEAWDHGPVIPSVYQEFKIFRDSPIDGRARSFDPVTATSKTASISLAPVLENRIRELYDFYKSLDALALSNLSHTTGGPWRHARSMFANGLNADRRIDTDMITRFHRLLHA